MIDSSDEDEVVVVGHKKNNQKRAAAASSSKRRRKKPSGPPPRLAWGAGGPVGGSSSLGDGLGGVGASFRKNGTSGFSGGSGGGAKKFDAGSEVDDLWADDDDASPSAFVASSSSAMASASASASSRRAAGKAGGNSRNTKRAKKGDSSSKAGQSISASSSSMMWVDKYAPTNATDLCVAPKKVKEIREWMVHANSPPPPVDQSLNEDCMSQQQQQILGPGMQQQQQVIPRLLILVGSPGVGKSQTIRVLASELGYTVQQWNDAHQDTTTGRGGYSRDSALSVCFQSQLSSFEEFLSSAGTGFSPLEFSRGSTTSALSLDVSSKKKGSAAKGRKKTSGGSKGSIILIEDIPNLHSPEAAMTFRNIMSQHIYRSKTPTVLIFSDVCEGKHRPSDLERLIGSSLLYSSLARICQIHGVAKPKMKKCLQTIVKAERLTISDSLFDELHSSSKGDMRHAIMALQFQYASAVDGNDIGLRGQYHDRDRDTKLSTFHALGKLLYAKRKKLGAGGGNATNSSAVWNSLPGLLYDSRPPLEFVPEDVMNKSDIEHSGAVSFLSYHCPEFFTDEMELSTALDHFSDASMFLDRSQSVNRDRSDSIFPLEYVSSIAGRAVANANKNPAPNRFRQLSAPKVFEVMQKKRGNDISMLQLCKRLSCGSDVLCLGANICSTNHFVVDTLPYMRNIVPGEVDSALANLYSYARPINQGGANLQADSANILQKHIKEQNELLADDDIADDDSVDGQPTGTHGGESHTNVEIERKMPPPSKSVKFSAPSAPHKHEVIIID